MADQTVRMVSSDGKDVADVPLYQIEYFKSKGATVVEPPPPQVDRGGLTHPLTSMLAPELEGVRSKLNTATDAPHGQPIMARSRTGTLYPSETGTGAVNAMKAGARGAGGAILDQVEGVTSPLGVATMGAVKGVSAIAKSPAAQATIGRGLQFAGNYGSIKTPVGKIGDALVNAATEARDATLKGERYLPNKSGLPATGSGAQTSRIPYASPTGDTAVQVDRYLPNASGVPDRGVSQGPLPQSTASMVDPYHPNTSGYVPGSGSRNTTLRTGADIPVEVDRYMPNSGGMPTSTSVSPSGGRVPYATPTDVPGALSASDKALLMRQGYSPELIQRVEQASMTRTPPQSPAPARPPIRVSSSSPMQPAAPTPSSPSQPLPLYPSAGTVKGVTSNALETASNVALAAGHWDEAERLIGQSLQSFFQGSGGPMVGIMAAAIAHKARQVVEPLRADPAFQRAAPAKQQQMIQQALRQPGARGSLTNALGS